MRSAFESSRWICCGLALAAASFVTATAAAEGFLESCINGQCGGNSNTGSCFCDSSCFDFGDCCNDVCVFCPGQCETCNGPSCGGGGPGFCFCDSACFDFGDCCDDVCSECPAQCETCNGASSCGGGGPGNCFCDSACFDFNDCCNDVCSECAAQCETCNGASSCGGQGPGNCFCDSACFGFSDCCDDVCSECPRLGGCNPPPVNNNCANSIAIGPGAIVNLAFDNINATTDGPAHAADCDFFDDPQISNDIWYNWTSNRTGEWVISLCGSDYDTEIAVYDDCNCSFPAGDLLACDDDTCGLQSQVTIDTVSNTCYKIRVGGFAGEEGAGVLNIFQLVCQSATNDCCVGGGGPGCNNPGCCEAVCDLDPFCCDVAWDGICAGEANDVCTTCGGGVCDTAVNNCCLPGGGPGCSNSTCCAAVCDVDTFCCNFSWDAICAGEAGQLCGHLPACCMPNDACVGDVNDNNIVNGADLGQLLLDFNTDGCPTGPADSNFSTDLNDNGIVNGADLGQLLLNFGPCP